MYVCVCLQSENSDGGVSGGAQIGGMRNSRVRTVPSSPLARVFGFGQLAAGLAMGTVAEAVRQSVAGGKGGDAGEKGSNVKNYVATDSNAERLAETLCRMREAALKLGQMLSIQVRTNFHKKKDVVVVYLSLEVLLVSLVCLAQASCRNAVCYLKTRLCDDGRFVWAE